MSAVEEFHGLTLHSQYDTPSEQVASEVIALWTRNRILPPGASPQERARQVVLAALDTEGRAIGVNTVYAGTLPQSNPSAAAESCYYYRMFIEPAHRRPHLMRAMTVKAYDVLRRHRPADGPGCFAIITDNMGLTGPGMLRLFERNGYLIRSRLPNGALLIVKGF
jgi:hypothetical protein